MLLKFNTKSQFHANIIVKASNSFTLGGAVMVRELQGKNRKTVFNRIPHFLSINFV